MPRPIDLAKGCQPRQGRNVSGTAIFYEAAFNLGELGTFDGELRSSKIDQIRTTE